jgi:lipopolysaccharide/colanic/teichoic acid biosynthesis glycosyltransferase
VDFLQSPGDEGAHVGRAPSEPQSAPDRPGCGQSISRRPPVGGVGKRIFDIVFSALAILFLAPLLIVVAIAVRLDSPGPALFRQARGGFRGKPFQIYKFRTMRVAEDGMHVRQFVEGDWRVTRIGQLLRRSNLDELPQFINVLKGDMSLVGPRPHAVVHDQHFSASDRRYRGRHDARPGITGLAQVSGSRGPVTSDDLLRARVTYDLRYLYAWSFWLDMMIITRTAWQTLAAIYSTFPRWPKNASGALNRIGAALRQAVKTRSLAALREYMKWRAFGKRLQRQQRLNEAYDWRFDVETSREIALVDAGLESAAAESANSVYRCVWAPVFHEAIAAMEIAHERFTFVDYGSGKGKAMFLAADFPFRRIVGVECSPVLHEIALRNCLTYKNPAQRCREITPVLGDAVSFEPPEGPLVCYFFNPFDAPTTQRVLARLRARVERGQEIYIAFLNMRSIKENVAILRLESLFRTVAGGRQFIILRSHLPESGGVRRASRPSSPRGALVLGDALMRQHSRRDGEHKRDSRVSR